MTKSEGKIMSTLLGQRGNWVTREQLMMTLWNTDEFVTDATLSVHISRLRNKLKELTNGKDIIKTKKGVGYYID
ncbi:MAG: helix-turn-helix domain-containing protein [Thomasclavelia ramosa]|nr:helix-turn-helix domain-containing protein [Thomasclavelia ramosa]